MYNYKSCFHKDENKDKREKVYKNAEENVDYFFTEGVIERKLECRDGQYEMAMDVISAIRDNQILLVEAGVGIGKSYAYLIPIFESIKNDPEFKGFIVSTSTIALQEQLISDIKKVSEIVGINIPVEIAKGKNNYICKKRLDQFCDRLKPEEKELFNYIYEQIDNGIFDRKDYDELTEREWKNINVTHCNYQNCKYALNCPYRVKRYNMSQSTFTICNHDLLIESLKRDEDNQILKTPSVLVIDEAHNLEEKIRNNYKNTLDKKDIESVLCDLYNNQLNHGNRREKIDDKFFQNLTGLFVNLTNSAKDEVDRVTKETVDYSDFDRVNLVLSNDVINNTNVLLYYLNKGIQDVKKFEKVYWPIQYSIKEKLENIIEVLNDILKNNNSDNNYWIDFYNKDYINISYSPKEIDNIGRVLFGKGDYAKIFTSATLTTGIDDYEYFKRNIGLDKIIGQSIYCEPQLSSPFNYDENMLIYHNPLLASPKDRDQYLNDVSNEIIKLINLTEGRSLVLFTSKRDMNLVYDKVNGKIPYNLLIQDDSSSASKLKESFKKDSSSCLFATGAFWEGMNIEGETLSSVIIPKLPFPVVDPIIQAKASKYTNGFKEVYMPEMIVKLRQGMGRLIRSETDTGIVAILDSRMNTYNNKYNDIISDVFLTNNVTDDYGEVQEFVKEKVLHR